MKKITEIKLTTEGKNALSILVKGRNTAQKVMLQVKIILSYADAKKQEAIAGELVTNRKTVGKWLRRYN